MKTFPSSHNDVSFEAYHSKKSLIKEVLSSFWNKYTFEDVLFFYSFCLLNFYEKDPAFRHMSTEDTLSFVKKYALSDLNDLHFPVTEDMFHSSVQGTLEGRLQIDKNKDSFAFMKNIVETGRSLLKVRD